MRQFIGINLKKFKYIFFIPTVLFTFFIWILILFVDSQKKYTLPEKIFLPPAMGLYAGFFIFILAFFSGYLSFYKKKKVLNKYPFNEIESELGFKRQLFGKDNIWRFTDEILIGFCREFPIRIHYVEIDGSRVGITALTETKESDEIFLIERLDCVEKEKIYFDLDESSMIFEFKPFKTKTIDEIEKELVTFIELLEKAGFKPRALENGLVYSG